MIMFQIRMTFFFFIEHKRRAFEEYPGQYNEKWKRPELNPLKFIQKQQMYHKSDFCIYFWGLLFWKHGIDLCEEQPTERIIHTCALLTE